MPFENITKRREKRSFKEKKKKEIIALMEEQSRLHKAERKLGLIELKEPYQRGWKKFYVLREDVLNRKDADVFKEILKLIQHTIYSRKPDFTYKDFKTKKILPMEHGFHPISKAKYEKLDPKIKKHFGLSYIYGYYNKYDSTPRQAYIVYRYCGPEYYFVTKIDKNIVTHAHAIDSVIESRLAEIYNYIDHHWREIARAMHWHNTRSGDDFYRMREIMLDEICHIEMLDKE
jgi:hypothetical protein